jgi:hypothetical protein
MATLFTTTPSSLSGDVYGTTFVHTLLFPYDYSVWNLGDGTYIYDQQSVAHSYDYNGTYQVSVTAGTYSGFQFTDSATVTVDFAHRDMLIFSQIPSEFGMTGKETTTPFVISLTSLKIDEPISVCLYAHNSRSSPHFAVPDKWGFLVPKWKFIDATTKQEFGESVLVDTKPLYKDSKVVGVSGQLSFYYIDDSSTGLGSEDEQPLLIVATLSTENFTYPPESKFYDYKSYSNPKTTKATMIWHVNQTPVTNYKVTENYLNDVYPIKWKDVPFPVMITCLFKEEDPETGLFKDPVDVLGYPSTNDIGLLNPITLTLNGTGFSIPSSMYSVETPLYFKATDENGNACPGYIFTTITPLTTFPGEVRVAVNSTIDNQGTIEGSFSFPYGYPIYAQTFVNNTYKSNINVIALYDFNLIPGITQPFNIYSVDVPTLSAVNVTYNEISGTAATYGLSFNPQINRMYAVDADQDTLMYFDPPYNLTGSKQLSTITGLFPTVPSYTSIDKQNNVWVSLFNSHHLLKFDKNLNYLLSATPSVSLPVDTVVEGSLVVASSVIETDQDNNIWVSFAHPVSSMLFKFDSEGNEILRASQFSLSSVPVSMAIDPYKNAWVCCYNSNSIDLYGSTDGQLLSSINEGFIHPTYTALDRNANVWFTHGYDFVSKYDVRTHQLSTWKFENSLSVVTVTNRPYTSQETYQATYENEIWAGLGIDVYDRVWVVDGVNNTVGVFKTNDPTYLYTTSLTPAVLSEVARSGEVSGDWTGNRWYQKYGGYNETSIADTSAPFRVYDINDFQLAKVNETFDFSNYMESLALPEILSKNNEFFNTFLPAVVGNGIVSEESMGRVAYERIANFVQTHSDLETSEVDQLISLAKQLSVQPKTFGADFPAAIQRLINTFSVSKQRLRGNVAYSSNLQDNIKELLQPTSLVTADEVLIVKDRQHNIYQFVVVSPQNNLTTYPLSQLEIPQLRNPLLDNYYFFRYNEEKIGYKGNIIDWDSDQTTISYNLSTSEQWYGDEGLADLMFNSLLTKHLFLD